MSRERVVSLYYGCCLHMFNTRSGSGLFHCADRGSTFVVYYQTLNDQNWVVGCAGGRRDVLHWTVATTTTPHYTNRENQAGVVNLMFWLGSFVLCSFGCAAVRYGAVLNIFSLSRACWTLMRSCGLEEIIMNGRHVNGENDASRWKHYRAENVSSQLSTLDSLSFSITVSQVNEIHMCAYWGIQKISLWFRISTMQIVYVEFALNIIH